MSKVTVSYRAESVNVSNSWPVAVVRNGFDRTFRTIEHDQHLSERSILAASPLIHCIEEEVTSGCQVSEHDQHLSERSISRHAFGSDGDNMRFKPECSWWLAAFGMVAKTQFPKTVSLSLPTEWSLSSFCYLTLTLPTESRLRSRLLTESFGLAAPSPFLSLPTESRLRLRCSLFFSVSLFMSLSTEWGLQRRLSMECNRLFYSLFLLSSTLHDAFPSD
jgi:hypothetical protein